MNFDESILSKRELFFFNILKKNKEVSSEEFVRILLEEKGEVTTRQSAIVCVKYLQSKIAEFGYIIRRKSGIGAGKIAVYEMKFVKMN